VAAGIRLSEARFEPRADDVERHRSDAQIPELDKLRGPPSRHGKRGGPPRATDDGDVEGEDARQERAQFLDGCRARELCEGDVGQSQQYLVDDVVGDLLGY